LPRHFYVFPAVAIYIAAFEAFLQENLTFARARLEDSGDPTITPILGNIDELKAQRGPFKDWVGEIFRLFDRRGLGIDMASPEFQNLFALKELRNATIHYNPAFIEHIYWPARLEQALQRTKLEVLNAGWATNFSRPQIADWARETVKAAIELFCDASGGENPFTADYPSGWESTSS
jgi:hypothetical protein